jgi:hypothetical protein
VLIEETDDSLGVVQKEARVLLDELRGGGVRLDAAESQSQLRSPNPRPTEHSDGVYILPIIKTAAERKQHTAGASSAISTAAATEGEKEPTLLIKTRLNGKHQWEWTYKANAPFSEVNLIIYYLAWLPTSSAHLYFTAQRTLCYRLWNYRGTNFFFL